ncbi:hypothetical protein LTS18_007686, partial [Coniosporium uncinatum]
QILGIITGLIPVVWVALLMVLVPIFCRLLATFCGAITTAEVELMTQQWFFAFEVIQVFLITTFASGASAVLSSAINQPSQIPNLLAQNLPEASNFYISYFILYGIGIASLQLANVVAILLYWVLGALMDKTPRKKYNRYTTVPGIKWGSFYPKYTLLGVICLSYSCIAPLVLGFAVIGLVLLYLAFKYNMLYAQDCTPVNTNGAGYQRALQHLMVGVYLAEVCLIGLFAIKTGGSSGSAGPLILEIIFLVATILFHRYVRSMMAPLVHSLPRDLLSASIHKNAIPTQAEAEEGTAAGTLGQEMTDFNDKHGSMDGLKHDNGSTYLQNKPQGKGPKVWLHWLLHPTSLPQFADFFRHPLPDYSEEVRREAYLNPSIVSPLELIWIPHDEAGISEHEMQQSRKDLPQVDITDKEAWLNEKGKLEMPFSGAEDEKNSELARRAPIYEQPVFY